MTATIGALAPFAPPVICDFGWESGLATYTYTVNSVNYPPTPAAYSAAINYTQGADIFYSGVEYVCVGPNGPTSPNVVVTPGTNTAVWRAVPYRDMYNQTPLGQTVIFDAVDLLNTGLPKVITPSGVSIVSYSWSFGNGQVGFGSTAQTIYAYNQGPPDIQAMLTIVDSLGRTYSCAHYLALENAPPGIESAGFVIGSTPPLHTYTFSVTDTLHTSETITTRSFHGTRRPTDVVAIAELITRHGVEHRSVTDTLATSEVITFLKH